MRNRYKGVAAVLLSLIVICGLAACGSSSSSSSSSAPEEGGSSTEAVADSGSSAGAGEDCVSKATAATEKARAPIKAPLPPGPLELDKLRGKNVWMIVVQQNEFSQTIEAGMDEAVKAAGLNVHYFFGKGNVQSWNEGVAKAVAQNADAIILFAIEPSAVSAPLSEAIAKGTTIIDMFNGSVHEPVPEGLYAHVTAEWGEAGEEMANWVLADSGCDASVAIFGAEVLPILKEMTDAASETVEANCPECKSTYVDANLGTLPTSFGPQVASTLRSDPGIDYVMAAFDGMVPLMLPSIQGSQVKVISHDGVPSSLDMIRSGGGQNATNGQPPGGWMGWVLIDQVARGMTGVEPADWVIPDRMFDETNIGNDNSELWTGGWEDYAEQFSTAWKGEG
jgi:ribose transport system substrate-binding protein